MFKEYRFFQIRHLDSILNDMDKDIYVVDLQGKSFILRVASDFQEDEARKAQQRIKSLFRKDLPAYCNDNVMSIGQTENLTKWFDLAAQKDWSHFRSDMSEQGGQEEINTMAHDQPVSDFVCSLRDHKFIFYLFYIYSDFMQLKLMSALCTQFS